MWFERWFHRGQRRAAADYIEVNPFGAERIDLVDMARSKEGHERLEQISQHRDYLRELVRPGDSHRAARERPVRPPRGADTGHD